MTPPPPALHLPYDAGAFRMAMGLRAVPLSGWIEIDTSHAAQMAERRRLLATLPEAVVAALPGTAPVQRELLATLAHHLPAHHPAWFRRAGNRLASALTGEAHDLRAPPLPLLGRLVAEDFCLLREEAEGLRLIAAVLCFPSRWSLAAKMGRLLGPIHAPVPFYPARLARPVDRFLGLLRPGRVAERLNWGVLDNPALHQAAGHGQSAPNTAVTAGNAGQTLFLRVERQTFRRLAGSGAIAFGIRLHVTPLADVARLPGEALRLRAAVLALPPEMAVYKSILPFRAALLAYLSAIVDEAPCHGRPAPQ